ncbi:protein C10 isoform X1 [Frankliniella occidentalis]|uniref:Protein C10 n=1 Tax=Frankliniella occidentalis TaxID=133901 RepID=A0A6J1SAD4_FRAOC|nr:protein C10 isoform X1 [Frankliniella occidentalis]
MTEGNIFSRETARAALNCILKAIDQSENASKIKEARDNAGNDMIKRMQFVFPIVMMLQMDVIKEYGFSEGRHGIIQFGQLVRALEREDAEIALLHSKVRSHFLPDIPSSSGASL